MNLKDVSSNELIAELSSRDLFEEVPEELKIWMKENKFTQITKFQFYHPIETRMFYDLAFLQTGDPKGIMRVFNSLQLEEKARESMSHRFQQTERASEEWATERGLDTADPKIQCLKLLEETGELAQGLLKGNEAQVIDSIGDVAVVLIIMCQQLQLGFENCLIRAYREIKDRTGKMIDGTFVKTEDLQNAGDQL